MHTMTPESDSMVKFSEEVGNLKHVERRGWILKDIEGCERVTGHMYRMALLAMTMNPVDGCDMNKVMKLCLVHDLAETRVGDITPHDSVPEDEKHRMESEAMKDLAAMLSPKQGLVLTTLYQEYEEKVSPEAQLTKDLDLYDMVHQAFEYEKKGVQEKGCLPDLDEFLRAEVIDRIKNKQVKAWINSILAQRQHFMTEVESKQTAINGSN